MQHFNYNHVVGIHQGIWSICHYYYFFKMYLFFWLWRISVATHRLCVAAVSGVTFCCGVQASHCGGFSCGAQALWAQASVVAA